MTAAPAVHTCHLPGCNVQVAPARLMCLRHWRMVPRDLQREVWRSYRPGQEIDKHPSHQWSAAAGAAIEAVERSMSASPYQRRFPAV